MTRDDLAESTRRIEPFGVRPMTKDMDPLTYGLMNKVIRTILTRIDDRVFSTWPLPQSWDPGSTARAVARHRSSK